MKSLPLTLGVSSQSVVGFSVSWGHLSPCESYLNQQHRTPGRGSLPQRLVFWVSMNLHLPLTMKTPTLILGTHPSNLILQFPLRGYK